jgi:hypothetical protein
MYCSVVSNEFTRVYFYQKTPVYTSIIPFEKNKIHVH